MGKIVVSILCYNAEPYIKACIDSIYGFADIIVIVEGSLDRQRIYGLSSSDKTIKIIDNYPDKQKKIKRFHMNKQEHDHRNIALRYCVPGDWYFTVDQDEIYTANDLKKLKKVLSSDNKTDMFRFTWYNFYYNFNLYLKEVSPPRIFKVRKGCRFVRRNSMVTSSGTPYEELNVRTFKDTEIIMYHYGYLHNIKKKMTLYGKKGMRWYNDIFTKFNWKNKDAIYRLNSKITGEAPGIHLHGGGKLKIFKEKHPASMRKSTLAKKDLIKLFASGKKEGSYDSIGLWAKILLALRYIYFEIIKRGT